MEIRVIGIKAVKVNREMTVRPEQTTDLVREIISVLLECQISTRDDNFLKSKMASLSQADHEATHVSVVRSTY